LAAPVWAALPATLGQMVELTAGFEFAGGLAGAWSMS
jgi:hypothetical protein